MAIGKKQLNLPGKAKKPTSPNFGEKVAPGKKGAALMKKGGSVKAKKGGKSSKTCQYLKEQLLYLIGVLILFLSHQHPLIFNQDAVSGICFWIYDAA